jgi:hypothetical protein
MGVSAELSRSAISTMHTSTQRTANQIVSKLFLLANP